MRGLGLIAALVGALCMGACVSTKPGGATTGAMIGGTIATAPAPAPTKASADSKIASGLSKIDAGIEYTGTKVKAACSGARLVMTGVAFYALAKPKWQEPIAIANASISSICDGPTPTDIPGALRTIAEAVGAAIAASQAARADPTTS